MFDKDKIKEKLPSCITVVPDPVGSIIAIDKNPTCPAPFKIEGIGHDYIPRTCMRSCVDYFIKVDDASSFNCSRDLIRYEGLLVGGSSGAHVCAAIKFIKQMGW